MIGDKEWNEKYEKLPTGEIRRRSDGAVLDPDDGHWYSPEGEKLESCFPEPKPGMRG